MKTILFSVVLLLVVTFDQSQAHKVKKEKNPRAANGKGKCNQKSACKVLEKELPKLESKVAALAKVDMKLQEQLNAMAKQITNLAKLVEEGKPTTNKIPTPTNEPTTPTPSSTTTTTTTTETIKKCTGTPELLYYNTFPGEAEAVRLLYSFAGVEFVDNRISPEDFTQNYKENVDLVPLGILPVLTTPCGSKIDQTSSIIRTVAEELNLFGKTNDEKAIIDVTLVSNKELSDIFWKIYRTPTTEAEKSALKVTYDKSLHIYCKYLQSLVKVNGGEFLMGDEMTAADIYLFDMFWRTRELMGISGYSGETYPLLQNIFVKVLQTENIKKYMVSQRKNGVNHYNIILQSLGI